MEPIKLTAQQARRFLLAHQGLLPPVRLKGTEGILRHRDKAGGSMYDGTMRIRRRTIPDGVRKESEAASIGARG